MLESDLLGKTNPLEFYLKHQQRMAREVSIKKSNNGTLFQPKVFALML